MLNFFRRIRRKLANENQFVKYSRYAIGEIVLVMVGILLALQVNNWNEARKTRDKEVVFLANIKSDLQLTKSEIEQFIAQRKNLINSANIVMEHYNGKSVDDWNLFNKHIVSIYSWQEFYLIDNTYQELKNSGNFAIISNNSIKNGLLNLYLLHNKLKNVEDHWKYDAEQTLHPGSYEKQDINSMSNNYMFQMSNGKMGSVGILSEESFGNMLKDQKQKNGFALAAMSFARMNESFLKMNEKCKELISQIDNELAK